MRVVPEAQAAHARPYIEVKGVSQIFRRGGTMTHALDRIDLTVLQGEFVAIVGYSGAGKTTLISLIAGLIRPDLGKVKLKGTEITEPGPDRGVVFQAPNLLSWLTARQNVALGVDRVDPVDVSNAMIWLASDEARYVTGVALPVDAGALIR